MLTCSSSFCIVFWISFYILFYINIRQKTAAQLTWRLNWRWALERVLPDSHDKVPGSIRSVTPKSDRREMRLTRWYRGRGDRGRRSCCHRYSRGTAESLRPRCSWLCYSDCASSSTITAAPTTAITAGDRMYNTDGKPRLSLPCKLLTSTKTDKKSSRHRTVKWRLCNTRCHQELNSCFITNTNTHPPNTHLGRQRFDSCAVDFVEICNVSDRKTIIKAAKRIFNCDKICHSYCDFYVGVTFLEIVYLTLHTPLLSINNSIKALGHHFGEPPDNHRIRVTSTITQESRQPSH